MQIADYGFDVTAFPAGAWEGLCMLIGLNYAGRDSKRHNAFMWAGLGLLVETTNNPVTGEYYAGSEVRRPEIGFAGYIGATGQTEMVDRFKRSVLERAEFVKDHGEGRSYI